MHLMVYNEVLDGRQKKEVCNRNCIVSMSEKRNCIVSELAEHIAKDLHAGDDSGLPRVPGKWFPNTHSLLPDSSSFSKGCPSSSVTALRDNTGFLLRQARCPPLYLAKPVFFCLRPREICDLSLTFLKSFTSKICNK